MTTQAAALVKTLVPHAGAPYASWITFRKAFRAIYGKEPTRKDFRLHRAAHVAATRVVLNDRY